MLRLLDKEEAAEAAINFLKERHEIVRVVRTVLEDGIWQVCVLVSYPSHRRLQVEIDPENGNICSL